VIKETKKKKKASTRPPGAQRMREERKKGGGHLSPHFLEEGESLVPRSTRGEGGRGGKGKERKEPGCVVYQVLAFLQKEKEREKR